MNRIDVLRDSIIDKLLTISNKDYLAALYQLVDKSSAEGNTVKLTEKQVVMLKMSEHDIENGRLLTQTEIDKSDLKWLKEL